MEALIGIAAGSTPALLLASKRGLTKPLLTPLITTLSDLDLPLLRPAGSLLARFGNNSQLHHPTARETQPIFHLVRIGRVILRRAGPSDRSVWTAFPQSNWPGRGHGQARRSGACLAIARLRFLRVGRSDLASPTGQS